MQEHVYFVYVLASERNGTLSVGVTSDLIKRVQEHREGLVAGFTRKYGVKTLVYWDFITTSTRHQTLAAQVEARAD